MPMTVAFRGMVDRSLAAASGCCVLPTIEHASTGEVAATTGETTGLELVRPRGIHGDSLETEAMSCVSRWKSFEESGSGSGINSMEPVDAMARCLLYEALLVRV